MDPQTLMDIASRREEERKKMETEIRRLWENSILHIAQLQKLSGVGYQRLRGFLALRGTGENLSDAELVRIHATLSR